MSRRDRFPLACAVWDTELCYQATQGIDATAPRALDAHMECERAYNNARAVEAFMCNQRGVSL